MTTALTHGGWPQCLRDEADEARCEARNWSRTATRLKAGGHKRAAKVARDEARTLVAHARSCERRAARAERQAAADCRATDELDMRAEARAEMGVSV